jgi:aldehyde dehydrogenase (NAD+)/aldehyde dehydrogenase (NAD(P)+)
MSGDGLPTFTTTPMADIPKIHATLRHNFRARDAERTSIAYRKKQLANLAYMIEDHKERWLEALRKDLGRAEPESEVMELGSAVKEAIDAYHSVEAWARPEGVPFSLDSFLMRPTIRKEAKGVVLIIVPFNYPVFLSLSPLAAAISAGNAAVLKPSEQVPATSALFAELVPQYLDPNFYRVVNGGVDETTELLKLQWDHILYTGNDRVAKVVAHAAAEHLTPLTLELGGKSPAIVHPSCDLESTARRIWYGKVANAGQTCVAPDYVLVPREFQDQLVEAFKSANDEFFPSGAANSRDYARIVNPRHADRIRALVAKTEGKIVFGGVEGVNVEERYVPPTLVRDVEGGDSLMSEEIFGPVLPIVPVDDMNGAIEFVNAGHHPLALYVFSKDKAVRDHVFANTQSGAAVANETTIHIGVKGLPFGGVGNSGYGVHTGKYGFDELSHHRSSIDVPFWLDFILKNRFPPFTSDKAKWISSIFGYKCPPRP